MFSLVDLRRSDSFFQRNLQHLSFARVRLFRRLPLQYNVLRISLRLKRKHPKYRKKYPETHCKHLSLSSLQNTLNPSRGGLLELLHLVNARRRHLVGVGLSQHLGVAVHLRPAGAETTAAPCPSAELYCCCSPSGDLRGLLARCHD